ncbi:hypothetical protein CRG98_037125 [Punica granatum]|uniref:Uncharacterized protein n=1 Tax=Punica granatum TaxID=22663 RepID=A0A2I0IFB7_PUNGR|nr:hypothetical protein CRG98_037125 [Punica granatum]
MDANTVDAKSVDAKSVDAIKLLGRSPWKAVRWTRSPKSNKVTRPKPMESSKVDAKSVDAKSGKQ